MEQKEKRFSKGGIFLICGSLLVIFWMFGLPVFFYLWWQKITFLPDKIYFPVEEFLALNAHPNSPLVYVGSFVIIVSTILLSWKFNGKPDKKYKYILLSTMIILLAALLFPCLCRPREVSRRVRCWQDMKQSYYGLLAYAEANNSMLPETFSIIPECKHRVNYYGKGRSLKDAPFVLFEDAERCHAGDMRHIMMSDMTIKVFYPWKK